LLEYRRHQSVRRQAGAVKIQNEIQGAI